MPWWHDRYKRQSVVHLAEKFFLKYFSNTLPWLEAKLQQCENKMPIHCWDERQFSSSPIAILRRKLQFLLTLKAWFCLWEFFTHHDYKRNHLKRHLPMNFWSPWAPRRIFCFTLRPQQRVLGRWSIKGNGCFLMCTSSLHHSCMSNLRLQISPKNGLCEPVQFGPGGIKRIS